MRSFSCTCGNETFAVYLDMSAALDTASHQQLTPAVDPADLDAMADAYHIPRTPVTLRITHKDQPMTDATLMELLKEVRWKTLKLLEDVDEAQSRFTPPGLNNTILWHAGHALIVVEHLCFSFSPGIQPHYPAGWFDKFSWKSNPATVAQWPPLSEVVARLTDQRQRVAALIETLTTDQLDRIVGEPPRNRTYRGMIVHALHDEAQHQGEIHLLKKLWQVKR